MTNPSEPVSSSDNSFRYFSNPCYEKGTKGKRSPAGYSEKISSEKLEYHKKTPNSTGGYKRWVKQVATTQSWNVYTNYRTVNTYEPALIQSSQSYKVWKVSKQEYVYGGNMRVSSYTNEHNISPSKMAISGNEKKRRIRELKKQNQYLPKDKKSLLEAREPDPNDIIWQSFHNHSRKGQRKEAFEYKSAEDFYIDIAQGAKANKSFDSEDEFNDEGI